MRFQAHLWYNENILNSKLCSTYYIYLHVKPEQNSNISDTLRAKWLQYQNMGLYPRTKNKPYGKRQKGSIHDIQDIINFLSILACYVYQSCSGNDNSWLRFAEEKRLNTEVGDFINLL